MVVTTRDVMVEDQHFTFMVVGIRGRQYVPEPADIDADGGRPSALVASVAALRMDAEVFDVVRGIERARERASSAGT